MESVEQFGRLLQKPKRAALLDRQLEKYVAVCKGSHEIPASVLPLSAGLRESSLVTWVETGGGELALVTADLFIELQRTQGKIKPAASYNRIMRALNPITTPVQRLQQRGESGEYALAPASDYAHIENNMPQGLIVDTLPMLVSGLRSQELRIGKYHPETVRDLGNYCLALFADRQPITLPA